MTDTERIYMNDCERFETERGHEYRSGDPITVRTDGGRLAGRVECRRDVRYYIYPFGVDLADGMEVEAEE